MSIIQRDGADSIRPETKGRGERVGEEYRISKLEFLFMWDDGKSRVGKQAIPGNLPEEFRVDRKTAIIHHAYSAAKPTRRVRARCKCIDINNA